MFKWFKKKEKEEIKVYNDNPPMQEPKKVKVPEYRIVKEPISLTNESSGKIEKVLMYVIQWRGAWGYETMFNHFVYFSDNREPERVCYFKTLEEAKVVLEVLQENSWDNCEVVYESEETTEVDESSINN